MRSYTNAKDIRERANRQLAASTHPPSSLAARPPHHTPREATTLHHRRHSSRMSLSLSLTITATVVARDLHTAHAYGTPEGYPLALHNHSVHHHIACCTETLPRGGTSGSLVALDRYTRPTPPQRRCRRPLPAAPYPLARHSRTVCAGSAGTARCIASRVPHIDPREREEGRRLTPAAAPRGTPHAPPPARTPTPSGAAGGGIRRT